MAPQKNSALKSTPRAESRPRQPPADKFEARRLELADAALATLAELGYAKTSLREIAQNSEFSHGVLHYYFTDKLDLISCSIRHYKQKCATRYDQVTAHARSCDELVEGFLGKLGETITEEPQMHSLWYDLRAQALFEDVFRADVAEIDALLENMVWRVIMRYAELGNAVPAISASASYALLDGLFQKYLLKHVSGDSKAIAHLIGEVRELLPLWTKPKV